jgi:hypothetical protein
MPLQLRSEPTHALQRNTADSSTCRASAPRPAVPPRRAEQLLAPHSRATSPLSSPISRRLASKSRSMSNRQKKKPRPRFVTSSLSRRAATADCDRENSLSGPRPVWLEFALVIGLVAWFFPAGRYLSFGVANSPFLGGLGRDRC